MILTGPRPRCMGTRKSERDDMGEDYLALQRGRATIHVGPLLQANVMILLFPFYRLENLETAHQGIVNRHHCTCVVEFATIVWRTEYRDQLAFREELVPVLNNLMRSNNEVHIMLLEKAAYDVGSKDEGNTTVILLPSCNVFIRICPQEVANQTSVRHIRWPYETANLIPH